MILTARQLELLHKANGRLVLPYRARLTPLAQDWIRQKKLSVGFSDAEYDATVRKSGDASLTPAKVAPVSTMPYLWWCQGPCGTSKAALTAVAKETPLAAMGILSDGSKAAAAVKHVAHAVKEQAAAGGVLIVEHASSAMVLANRNPSLRAVLGTSLAAVEDGMTSVAANVLVIEKNKHTLVQLRNMIGRFCRTTRAPSEALQRELQEAAACDCPGGGSHKCECDSSGQSSVSSRQ